jgi:hypothetical protein
LDLVTERRFVSGVVFLDYRLRLSVRDERPLIS